MKLTPQQLAHMADADIWRAKSAATATLTAELHALSKVLRAELSRRVGAWDVPEGFDPNAYQVARGESLDNLPYQYLDCPRFYSKSDTFAFRLLIWWGEGVHHCWMFKGQPMPAIRERLLSRAGEIDDQTGGNLRVWTGKDLWDGAVVTPLSEVDAVRLKPLDFLKIGTIHPLTAEHLSPDGLRTDALAAWHAVAPLLVG